MGARLTAKETALLVGFRWHDYEMEYGFENLHYRLVAWRERGASVPVPRHER